MRRVRIELNGHRDPAILDMHFVLTHHITSDDLRDDSSTSCVRPAWRLRETWSSRSDLAPRSPGAATSWSG